MNELIIGDHNYQQFLPGNVVVDGERKGHGLIPRDYSTHPQGFYSWAKAFDLPLIPRTEWSQRIKDMVTAKARIQDKRGSIPSRDQNGKGYCWAHSSTTASIVMRFLMGEPYADLSAFAVACIIKNYRDEGGWGAESLDWIQKNGIPDSKYWPQKSMSSSNDTPAMRADAALHKVTDQWADLSAAQYDRNLTFDQVGTLLLCSCPIVTDFNWWSHSVCAIELTDGSTMRNETRDDAGKKVSLKAFEEIWGINDPVTAGYGLLIWNSWGDSWSNKGMGFLTGSKAVPDGAVAPRDVMASAA